MGSVGDRVGEGQAWVSGKRGQVAEGSWDLTVHCSLFPVTDLPVLPSFRVSGWLPSLCQCHLQSGQATNPIPTDRHLVPDSPLAVWGRASVSSDHCCVQDTGVGDGKAPEGPR